MAEPLKCEIQDGIALLTLDRPETHNALGHTESAEAFEAVGARLNADDSVRAAILTGAGKSFSAGGDLRAMRAVLDLEPAAIAETYRRGIQRVPRAMLSIRVPTIAAVNGAAIGAGLDLACTCDIRLASDQARFAESFVKLGLVPGDGGAWLLPRVVGVSKAAELALTGDTIDAAEAARIGLVSRIVPAGSLLEEAFALARRIAANPAIAVRATKRLLREGATQSLEANLELAAALQALCHKTDENRAAIESFLSRSK
ncbi:MAG: crotonase/enoyl-CoA hydratase family protein [Alphaproteobacteria bacterium]|nr:crotonase/enoyl-CoA hydratase family protein [Alphaproteobacteria bacterium]